MSKFLSSSGFSGTKPALGGGESAASPLRTELVQRHLEKVLISTEMCRSKKLCQFLRFTVEEVLRGHGGELKEYAIAVGVFRRGREFDPGADPIVRVQARRLRAKLARYYQNEGRGEPMHIEYPVGGYCPVFVRRAPTPEPNKPAPPALPAREGRSARRIAVLPLADMGPDDGQRFAEGLTDELIHLLSLWPGVQVAARSSCYQFKSQSEDVRRIGEWLGVCALVAGSVRREGSRLRVLMQVIDTETGMNLWSAGYQWELKGVLETQEKISHEVAAIVKAHFAGWGAGPSREPAAERVNC